MGRVDRSSLGSSQPQGAYRGPGLTGWSRSRAGRGGKARSREELVLLMKTISFDYKDWARLRSKAISDGRWVHRAAPGRAYGHAPGHDQPYSKPREPNKTPASVIIIVFSDSTA